MIARLVGTLVSRDGGRAVIDVRDVGYAVHAPARALDDWAAEGGPVEIFVSTDVREDAIVLYGFQTDRDRVAFERLRLVDGVGPKVALAVLDALGLDALAAAVAADDLRALSLAPGVGKKLAQRLALELKGKLPASFAPLPAPAAAPAEAGPDLFALALARLGYARAEITRARERLLADGLGEDAAVADRVKAALQILARG